MDAYDFSSSEPWHCVDGGMDRFVASIVRYLEDHSGVATASESTKTDAKAAKKQKTSATTSSTTSTASGDALGPTISKGYKVLSINPSTTAAEKLEIKGTTANGTFTETYSHVINTAPLSIQRQMDMSGCELSYKQNQAIRTLHYDFSDKVRLSNVCWWM